jgi:CheY-like chemotaxis protein
MDIHCGVISVFSEGVGLGSCFSLEFPVVRKERSADLENGSHRVWTWRDPRNSVNYSENLLYKSEAHKYKESRIYKLWNWRYRRNSVICADNISNQGIDDSKTNFKNMQNSTSSTVIQKNQLAVEVDQRNSSSVSKISTIAPLDDTKNSSTLRILIVDDAPSNRKLLHRILCNEGHICETAVDGQQCVEMVNSKSENSVGYDLVLLDSEMPVMNGPTACKILRGMGHDSLVIIGVTGNVLPEDIQMFMDHGVDAVIGKPAKVTTIMDEYKRIKSAK